MVEHWEVRAEERGGGVVWGGVGYPELLLSNSTVRAILRTINGIFEWP